MPGAMTGLPRRVYSRDPSSCISERASTSPTETLFKRGTVRTSRGVRRYFRPASVATMYCDGCERMSSRAEDFVCRQRDESCGTVFYIKKVSTRLEEKREAADNIVKSALAGWT